MEDGLFDKRSETGHTENFWGDGLSEFVIDPEAEQKIKRKYMYKIQFWKTPHGSRYAPKGADITEIRVVPLRGEIDEYEGKLLYRVYYGKGMYDEYSNNSHRCDLNPDTTNWGDPEDRNCIFCYMPADHSSCGCSCHKECRFDTITNKLRPHC